MKILHVIQNLEKEKGGGVTERNLKLIEYLEKKNITNYTLSLKSNINNDSREASRNENRNYTLSYLYERFPLPFPNIFKIANLVRNADVIHLTSFWTLLNAYVYIFCKLFSKNYIICPAGALIIFGRSKTIKYIYYEVIGKRIIKDCSAIISITEKEKKQFRERNIPLSKIFNIPNGIDMPRNGSNKLFRNDDFSFNKKKPYILFVGRLNFIKGPDLLLKAFDSIADKIPNYNLIFAGSDDGMEKELKTDARKSRFAERIHFIGFINGLEKDKLYKNADILVIPSRSEAMSLVVLEAALHGLESIFTDQCGLDELSRRKFGQCVKVDSKAISNSIINHIKSKKTQKNSELIDYVSNNFNWDKISNKYIRVFKKIV